MTLIFTLSMPNNNSWNGKWSGAGKFYAIVKDFGSSKKTAEKCEALLKTGSWYHNFGDGWGASVSVQSATPADARMARKNTSGFCGYDWMVANILSYNSTRAPEKEASRQAEPAMA